MMMVNYANSGLQCMSNSSRNYSLSVYVKCNKGISKANAVPVARKEDDCTYSVMLEVDKGCPYISLSVLLTFVTQNTPLFSVGFMVLGVALGLFGRSMWKTVVFGLVAFSCIIALVVSYHVSKYVHSFRSSYCTNTCYPSMRLSGVSGSRSSPAPS